MGAVDVVGGVGEITPLCGDLAAGVVAGMAGGFYGSIGVEGFDFRRAGGGIEGDAGLGVVAMGGEQRLAGGGEVAVGCLETAFAKCFATVFLPASNGAKECGLFQSMKRKKSAICRAK